MQDLEALLAEDKALPDGSKEKLTPQKRKSLEGQLANRKGRYYDMVVQVDPSLITVEVNKLKERVAKEPNKQKAKRLRDTIAKLLRRLRAENEIYKTVRTATLVSAKKPVGVTSKSLSDAMDSVVDAVDEAMGYVSTEHIQYTPDELSKLDAQRNGIVRQIEKVEAEIELTEKTMSGRELLKQLRPLKRKLKALRKERDQIKVFRKRVSMSNKKIERTLAAIS